MRVGFALTVETELRSIGTGVSQHGHANGCATMPHGLTQVQVSVFGAREAKTRLRTIHDCRTNINVEVSIIGRFQHWRQKKAFAE